MKCLVPIFRVLVGVCLVSWLAGCGGSSGDAHGDHGHEDAHGHSPKYGGQLVELGKHQGNLEVVVDPKAGRMTAYVLDAHAENFVRLPLPGIALTAVVGGEEKALTLNPVGNPATGEKPGDTSQYEATADWLKGVSAFKATVRELPVKTLTFRNVEFSWPQR